MPTHSPERLFLDTFFIQAALNARDQYHENARRFLPRVRAAQEVWVTEAVLTEAANALSTMNRAGIVEFVRQPYQTTNMRVVPVDSTLLAQGLDLYAARRDKSWGLTDCISFVVMDEQGLSDALTGDHHFTQAGYRALLAPEK